MWKIPKSKALTCDWLDFEPVTIIDEYDGPMLFTIVDRNDQLYLAYFCARSSDAVRFLVVPTNDDIVRRLTSGDINLRESLARHRMWIFDLDKKWNPKKCWGVTFADLPRNLLPRPGVMLRAYMQPVMKREYASSITKGTTFTVHLSARPQLAVA